MVGVCHNIYQLEILRTLDNIKCGYLLECDLLYPSTIQEKARHLPFLRYKKG